MKILRNYTYTWWQIGIFKASLLFLGIAIGAYFHECLGKYTFEFAVVGIMLGLYIASVSFGKQDR